MQKLEWYIRVTDMDGRFIDEKSYRYMLRPVTWRKQGLSVLTWVQLAGYASNTAVLEVGFQRHR